LGKATDILMPVTGGKMFRAFTMQVRFGASGTGPAGFSLVIA